MKTAEQARDGISRWLMRTLQGGRVLRMPLLGITAVSTLTTALKAAGYEQLIIPAIAVLSVGSLAFIWAYDVFQVMNRQHRHKQDRSDNFAGPGIAMNSIIRGRQLAMFHAALDDDTDTHEFATHIDTETRAMLECWRDGIDLDAAFNASQDLAPDIDVPTTRTPAVADGGQTTIVPQCAACQTPGEPATHKDDDVVACPDCGDILYRRLNR